MIYFSIIIIFIIIIFIRVKHNQKDSKDDIQNVEIYDPMFFTKEGIEKHIYHDVSLVQSLFPKEDKLLNEYKVLKNSEFNNEVIHYSNIPDNEIKYVTLSDLEERKKEQIKNEVSILPDFTGKEWILETNKETSDNDESLLKVWPIPILTDTFVKAKNEKELKTALGNLIHEKLNIDLIFLDDYRGPLRKYLYLHQSIQTAFQSEFNTPMFIEIFGVVIHVNGKDINDIELENNGYRRTLEEELDGPIIIRILQANWSNVTYSGVNIPFYM